MEVGLTSVTTVLSELERHDLCWFTACLCTPLIGEDLAARLPKYRPTSLLARETNGDIEDFVPRWRDRLVRVPTTDVSVLGMLIDDLGQWLAAEYRAVHGPKTPTPE